MAVTAGWALLVCWGEDLGENPWEPLAEMSEQHPLLARDADKAGAVSYPGSSLPLGISCLSPPVEELSSA